MSRVPRLFYDGPLQPDGQITLSPAAAGHAVRVLRLRAGDAVILFNGSGRNYAGTLVKASGQQIQVKTESAGELEPEPVLRVELILGISRGQRMDFALQKATELGVTAISPVFTARSMVQLDPKRREQRIDHWRQVVIAACEQSGRRRLPRVDPPQDLSSWLSAQGDKNRPGMGLLLDPTAGRSLADLPPPPADGSVTLLIGPEGGLSADERRQAEDQHFTGVRLGPRILRTETAPLAAIAIIQVLWGDFR